jgi:hypothetical protein
MPSAPTPPTPKKKNIKLEEDCRVLKTARTRTQMTLCRFVNSCQSFREASCLNLQGSWRIVASGHPDDEDGGSTLLPNTDSYLPNAIMPRSRWHKVSTYNPHPAFNQICNYQLVTDQCGLIYRLSPTHVPSEKLRIGKTYVRTNSRDRQFIRHNTCPLWNNIHNCSTHNN